MCFLYKFSSISTGLLIILDSEKKVLAMKASKARLTWNCLAVLYAWPGGGSVFSYINTAKHSLYSQSVKIYAKVLNKNTDFFCLFVSTPHPFAEQEPRQRVHAVKDLIKQLPKPNQDTMQVLFRHLKR